MKESAAPAARFGSCAPPADFSAIVPLSRDEGPGEGPGAIPEVTIKAPPRAAKPPKEAEQVDFGYTHYDIVGQLFGCYWVVQQGEDVFFVDQHAAHERSLYESMMRRPLEPDSQMLLVPVVEKLTPAEYGTLMDNLDSFRELGFDIEEFGPLAVSVRAVPAIFSEPETAAFLHEAIAKLYGRNRVTAGEMKRAELIQSACKHAVKAGELLAKEEIELLLGDYAKSGVPMTCPHGRPVMVRMTKLEFEKLFRRVT